MISRGWKSLYGNGILRNVRPSRCVIRQVSLPFLRVPRMHFSWNHVRLAPDNEKNSKEPQLMIAFTCKKCDHRSSHTFSKQAYLTGTVAIQCPLCKNRHLIADNLNIFKSNNFNIEDVLKAQGETISKDANDLVFEDLPDSLKKKLSQYARDSPDENKR